MNKKILISVASIVAVLALLGGGTFAAWSDFDTLTDNSAGAGALVLDLSNGRTGGLALPFSYGRMAPGQQNESLVHLANAQLDFDPVRGVAAANAYVTMADLVGVEDGCLHSAAEDADQQANYAGASCDLANLNYAPEGQFKDEAIVQVTRFIGVVGATCPAVNGSYTVLPGQSLTLGTLQEVETGGRLLIGELENGESACLNISIQMPGAAGGFNNSAQGDSADFDLRFDLEQITP